MELGSIDERLISKIENKACVVGIIGLGYVGPPLLNCFVQKGFPTIAFGVDDSRIAQFNPPFVLVMNSNYRSTVFIGEISDLDGTLDY